MNFDLLSSKLTRNLLLGLLFSICVGLTTDREATLQGATPRGAVPHGTVLQGTVFQGTVLHGTVLQGATLQGANSTSDTTVISLQEFIARGLENSGQMKYRENDLSLAENQLQQAKLNRVIPSIRFSSQHGIIPGVTSSNPELSDGALYLDPNLKNDWEDWAIFTRAEIDAIQPIYTWGGIRNSILAAEYAKTSSEEQVNAIRAEASIQLLELYFSRLLAEELRTILDDARSTTERVGEELQTLMDEGNPDLDEADLFKYELFLADFAIQTAELDQSESAVKRLWDYILQPEPRQTYRPSDPYLEEINAELAPFETYQQSAFSHRPELKSVTAGMEAARLAVNATRSQNKPAILLGITASYANTPNRPRQTNPFIINSTNYANAGIGIVLRQNLNFATVQNQIEKNEIRYRKVQDLEQALTDGLMLELTDAYTKAKVARVTLDQTKNKLQTAKNWVGHEQLNWDLGFGNVDNLIEAVQKEFELRVELAQNIFDYNLMMARLHKAAGMPPEQLNEQD